MALVEQLVRGEVPVADAPARLKAIEESPAPFGPRAELWAFAATSGSGASWGTASGQGALRVTMLDRFAQGCAGNGPFLARLYYLYKQLCY